MLRCFMDVVCGVGFVVFAQWRGGEGSKYCSRKLQAVGSDGVRDGAGGLMATVVDER